MIFNIYFYNIYIYIYIYKYTIQTTNFTLKKFNSIKLRHPNVKITILSNPFDEILFYFN